jgi:hypothetical protein
MSEDAKFVLVGANDASWYLWNQSAWYWAMGVFGVFWLTLIVVAVILFIRTSRRDLPGADDSAQFATQWQAGITKITKPLGKSPAP